jgi:microcystin degradation protein MlrC
MRLAVARLWFCANSFVARRTPLADLRAHEWTNTAHALRHPRPGSELDGVARFLAERRDWRATLLRAASAPAGGPLTAEAFGTWLAEVEGGLRRESFDGVYLSLHGACQAEGDPIADLTIMRRVRAAVGHTPVVASFDMHANLPLETALLLDGASINRVWPHGGADGSALRALRMLEGIVEGRLRPVGALARISARTPEPELSAAMATMDGTVLDASLAWGFPWGDSPYGGASAMIWTDRDARRARTEVADLAERVQDWRPRRPRPSLEVDAAVATALARGEAHGANAQPARVALLDPADDPLAGGLADTPTLLRALLRAGADNAAFAALHDPELLAIVRAAGEGATLSRALGARTTREYGAPIAVNTRVVRIVPGSESEGTLAVLRAGGVDILLCEHRPAAIDPALFVRAGIDLASIQVVAIKGAEAARIAFAPHYPTIIACDSPGPACPDLARLPFKYSGVPHLPWSAAYAQSPETDPTVPLFATVPEARRA